jgi:hypothetical protein
MTSRLYRELLHRLRAVTTNRELFKRRQQALRECFQPILEESAEAQTRSLENYASLQVVAEDIIRWQSVVDELVQLHELYGIASMDKGDEAARQWQQKVREQAAAHCGLQLPRTLHSASPNTVDSGTVRRGSVFTDQYGPQT